ncbi:Hint domain-containing protein [Bradyrhizobium sp. HKCCYLS20291]|uniref:Hint domain-containing protein n=1 Tax=Bradyrhizobium sp. HKCCYLS20291 TaxID=3420766 RepID=UPI003EBB10CD
MAATETFNFAYQLSFSGSNFKIVDATPGGTVNAVGGGVTVKDPTPTNDMTVGDRIKVTDVIVGNLAQGNYDFVGQADAKDHGSTLSGIIVQGPNGTYYFLTDSPYSGNLNGVNGKLTITSYETTICFYAGTQIKTPDGEVAVETLKRGDQVRTHDGRVATVDWLGVQTVSLRFADRLRVLPIRIKAGALGDNVPARDLLVSPDHAILVEGALIHAGALVNGTSIVRETDVPTTFTYYHVEVEDHSLILAENTPAETFVDNIDRLHFDNWAEHEALYPNGKPINELPYPRAKSHRQVPVATRVMLAARAQELVPGAADDTAAA